jgi:hypothetical protein
MADAIRVLAQWTEQEFDYCNCDLLGQTLELSFGRRSNAQLPLTIGHRCPTTQR